MDKKDFNYFITQKLKWNLYHNPFNLIYLYYLVVNLGIHVYYTIVSAHIQNLWTKQVLR